MGGGGRGASLQAGEEVRVGGRGADAEGEIPISTPGSGMPSETDESAHGHHHRERHQQQPDGGRAELRARGPTAEIIASTWVRPGRG